MAAAFFSLFPFHFSLFFVPLTTFKVLSLEKFQNIFWFFARLFVPLHPLNKNTNKIMDDYPADSNKR